MHYSRSIHCLEVCNFIVQSKRRREWIRFSRFFLLNLRVLNFYFKVSNFCFLWFLERIVQKINDTIIYTSSPFQFKDTSSPSTPWRIFPPWHDTFTILHQDQITNFNHNQRKHTTLFFTPLENTPLSFIQTYHHTLWWLSYPNIHFK